MLRISQLQVTGDLLVPQGSERISFLVQRFLMRRMGRGR
jgi:hypothetical protein